MHVAQRRRGFLDIKEVSRANCTLIDLTANHPCDRAPLGTPWRVVPPERHSAAGRHAAATSAILLPHAWKYIRY